MGRMEQMSFFSQTPDFRPAPSPEVKRDPDRLRFFQREAVDALTSELQAKRSTVLRLFCGGGKTRTAAAFIRTWPGRVLWCAATDFLLEQARRTLEEVCGELVSLEQGKFYADSSRIVVGSIMTLKDERLLSHAPDKFSLVVFDECHGIAANTPRAIAAHFASAKLLGLSATPFRMDKRPVVGEGAIFETIAFSRDIRFGLDEGYFVPFEPIRREIKSVNLDGVRMHGADFKLGDLEKEIAKAAAPIAKIAWEESEEGELETLIYTPGVASAKAVADTFSELARTKWGERACESIDGETDPARRKQLRQEFGGRLRAVANCNLLTQGVDIPNLRCVIIARPTKSAPLFEQMATRGGRPLPGLVDHEKRDARLAAIEGSAKPRYRLVDIAGNAGRHVLSGAVDLVASNLTPIERRAAEKIEATRRGLTADQVVDEARKASAEEAKVALEAESKRIGELAAAAEIEATRQTWDPLKRLGVEDKIEGIEPTWAKQPPTPDQRKWMEKNKIKFKNQTRASILKLQRESMRWLREGLASLGQRRELARQGLPVEISYGLASRIMLKIQQCHYNKNAWLPAVQTMIADGRQPGED